MKIKIISLVLLSLTSYAQERFYSYDEQVSILIPSGWTNHPSSGWIHVPMYVDFGTTDDHRHNYRFTLGDYVYLQGKNTNTNGVAVDYVRSPFNSDNILTAAQKSEIYAGSFQTNENTVINQFIGGLFTNWISSYPQQFDVDEQPLSRENGLISKIYDYTIDGGGSDLIYGKHIYVLDGLRLNVFEIIYASDSADKDFFEEVNPEPRSSNPILNDWDDNILPDSSVLLSIGPYAEFSEPFFIPSGMKMDFLYVSPWKSYGVIQIKHLNSPYWIDVIGYNSYNEFSLVDHIVGPKFVRVHQKQHNTYDAVDRSTGRILVYSFPPTSFVAGELTEVAPDNNSTNVLNDQLEDALKSIDTLQTQVDLLYNQLVNPDATITNTITNSVGYTLSEVADMRLGSQMVSVSNSQALLRFGLDMSDDLTATWQTNAYEIEVEIPATNDVQFFRLRMD